jgi:GGDEF domain-containing protein
MKFSIRQVFFNLKLALVLLVVGVIFLSIEVIAISQYSSKLSALKNQHFLVKKIISTDLNDSAMAFIMINSDLAELQLFTRHANQTVYLDSLTGTQEEQKLLGNTLTSSSDEFQEAVLFWVESMEKSRNPMYKRMLSSKNLYVSDIDRMIDYQIQLIDDTVNITKKTVLALLIFSFLVFFFYQWRLKQVYRDIKHACTLDHNVDKEETATEEIDFIVRKLYRRMPSSSSNPMLLNLQSGLNNEKGMVTAYNAKRNSKIKGTLFLAHFEIDRYDEVCSKLSNEEVGNILRKLGEILSMYEQPFDTIGHLENNSFAFLMTRSSKDVALGDAERIISSVHESIFPVSSGVFKITLSGGFLLKSPSKTLEETLKDVAKITEKAKEAGGNRMAQLRQSSDVFR